MLLWTSAQSAQGDLTGEEDRGGSHLPAPFVSFRATSKTQLSACCQRPQSVETALTAVYTQRKEKGGKREEKKIANKYGGGWNTWNATTHLWSLWHIIQSHLSDRPAMNNAAQGGLTLLHRLVICTVIIRWELISAVGNKSSIWTSPRWLRTKWHALIEHKESVKFNIELCLLQMLLGLSWIKKFFFIGFTSITKLWNLCHYKLLYM